MQSPSRFRFVRLLVTLLFVAGCNRGPKMVPVTGKVIYNGRPLEFGVVMFQPPSGQPAQGTIQPDGTFTLSTYRSNDGAVSGKHKVRVACYESMRPGFAKGPGEMALGKPLVPEKYTLIDSSGLSADVDADHKDFTFELSGPAG
jgi:hypothetical protein